MELKFNSENNLQTIFEITCKIETPKNRGTGVVIATKNDGLHYILTAKHCLLGEDFDEEIKNLDVTVCVPNERTGFTSFNLEETDNIFYPENKSIDAAVIVLKVERSIAVPQIKFINTRILSGNCSLRGYPNPFEEEGVTLPVEYNDFDKVFVSKTVLASYDETPLYACKGFSGGGIFYEREEELFLAGLAYELESFQIFPVCNLSFLNNILSSKNLPEVEFESLPVEESLSRDIKTLKEKTELALNSIEEKLGNKFFLERKQPNILFEKEFNRSNVIIFKGESGIGKSSFAKSVMYRLQKKGYFVLAFKGNSFCQETIENSFSFISNNFTNIFKYLTEENKIAVFIDELETYLDPDSNNCLKEFLNICKNFKNIQLFATCSNLEYQRIELAIGNEISENLGIIDIPKFSDEEFLEITTQFEFLNNLLQKESLKNLLKHPFYCNLAIAHQHFYSKSEKLTEKKFKEILWNEIICKNDPEREHLFEQIARKRALSQHLYIKIENANHQLIKDLEVDGIILMEEELKKNYRPSQDIYENIALFRFAEEIFKQKENVNDFFEKLGDDDATTRRIFRIWLEEKLIEPAQNINNFILSVLENSELSYTSWREDTITSILRSQHCQNFFNANQELIEDENFKFLIDCINVLKKSCQKILFDKGSSVANEFNHFFLLAPFGSGWKSLFENLEKYLDDLSFYWPLILDLIVDSWYKKLFFINEEIPQESKIVGKILLKILEEAKLEYGRFSWENTKYLTKDTEVAIRVLLRLCPILTKTNEFEYLLKDASSYKTKYFENYRLKEFYETFVKYSLTGIYSREICKVFPEQIIDLMNNHWLEKERASWDSNSEPERIFGIDHCLNFGFSAGAFNTPLFSLLDFHPEKALKFIVTFFNNATLLYVERRSKIREELTDINIHYDLNDDKVFTIQKGSASYWSLYRGGLESSPVILHSILMALEDWLFRLCQNPSEKNKELVEYAYSFILKNSNNVAVTAVLASVALAYPEKIGVLCFPILKIQEFYAWEQRRLCSELNPLYPTSFDNSFIKKERQESNEMPHRRFMLHHLAVIFDFKSYLPKPDKISVNKKSKEEKNQRILDKIGEIILWSKRIFETKKNDNLRFEWETKFKNYKENEEEIEDFIKNSAIGKDLELIYFAAVGISFLDPKTDNQEWDWCVAKILDFYQEEIINLNKLNQYGGPFIKSPYFKPAFQSLTKIFPLVKESQQKKIKEDIFLSLLFLLSGNNIEDDEVIFHSLRNDLWEKDEKFAYSCFLGMISYSKIHKQEKSFQERMIFSKEKEKLLNLVCNNKETCSETIDFSLQTHSAWYLFFSCKIIPYQTSNHKLQLFVRQVFLEIFNATKSPNGLISKPDLFFISTKFAEYLALFLLNQLKDDSRKLFSEILDKIFDHEEGDDSSGYKFVEQILNAIILYVADYSINNFWELWKILEEKIETSHKPYFTSSLFLSLNWKIDTEHWEPLSNKKRYVKNLISKLGHHNLTAVLKLLALIGRKTLLPEAILNLNSLLDINPSLMEELEKGNESFFYCEKLIQEIFESHLEYILQEKEFKKGFLELLEKMISKESSFAYSVREKLLSS